MYSVQWSQPIIPFYHEQFVIAFLSIPTLTKDNAEKNELQIQLNRKAKLQIAPKALTKLHSAGEKDYWLPFPFQLFRWFLKLLDLTEILKTENRILGLAKSSGMLRKSFFLDKTEFVNVLPKTKSSHLIESIILA